ncbi:unnamed protein product [Cunninghamella echinulata]
MGQQASKRIIFKRKKNPHPMKETDIGLPSPTVTSSSSGTRPSTFRYTKEGRRYHEDESLLYVLPNDDEECDRAHQQHWLFRYLFQSNFQSPLDTPLKEGIRVLDSGCGPATWLLEMCESYPQSDFYGIDISPMFPENIKPHNVTFDIANVAEGLPFPDNHFDFVFQRLLVFALTADQWEKAFRELIRVVKPGGWVEFVEVDVNAKRAGPLFSVITASMRQMLLSRDMVPNIGNKLEDYVILHRLENMKVTTKDFPLKHGGKLGDLFWYVYPFFFYVFIF